MASNAQGYFTMVLHAHLPFIREPEHDRFLEEYWLYEAVVETYLPLLVSLENLVRDGVDFRLTFTLTPTLIAMLDDELLRDRCERRLGELIELAEKETRRLRSEPELAEVAQFYVDRFRALDEFYRVRCQRDLVGAFARLQEMGRIEILTSAATHGYLPLLRHEPSSVGAQIRVAVDAYRERFGRAPEGIWLPECGYYPGLDDVLAEHGLRFFFLESHGVLHGSDRPHYGVYAPIVCPSGVAAFARDPECAKQVWSVEEGFPGAPDYREFYRDIGFDLPLETVGPYLCPDGMRIQTGIKYHRVTGSDEKEVYVRARAMQQAAEHADTFLRWRREQLAWLTEHMERRPIILAPYDAELFGHWWFEGPDWINFLLRKIAFDQGELKTATPSEYLAEYSDAQVTTPSASSWGDGGYNQVWLNETNDWIVPELLAAGSEMTRLARAGHAGDDLRRRVLAQAGRELMLAQSSDWAFILRNETATEFARSRVTQHLDAFRQLTAGVRGAGAGSSGTDLELLERLERKNNLFPRLDSDVFAGDHSRGADILVSAPRHVAFLSAEAAPYVKVGGLADVVAALPPALGEWGLRTTVLIPGFRTIDRGKFGVQPLLDGLWTQVGARSVAFRLSEARSPATGVRVLLVENDEYFDRDGVYVDPETGEEYPDSGERFVFFTRACLEALRALGERVDVVHSHDHQTALASAYVKLHYPDDPILGGAATVYTLHNLGYQGVYPPEILDVCGFGRSQFAPGQPFEHYGSVNFMKVGISFADKVNTVSENYAREICEDEDLGAGLGGVLRSRTRDFSGILNGIDIDEWNPGGDEHLPAPFTADDLAGKLLAKKRLFELGDLDPARLDAPLIGIISRLVDQKGFDLVHEELERILELGPSVIVLGTGLRKYEDFFRDAATRYAGQVAALIKFDNGLAHLIEGGSDLFLMPSLYEPCGLNQMYSLRYGTIPIVRATGGLADTVDDDDVHAGSGVGFAFSDYSADALFDAVERAIRAYANRERWGGIVTRAMTRDHSWGGSALRYRDLYRAALRAGTVQR